MIDPVAAFSFAGVSLAVAISPGPSWAYVLSATLNGGRRAGFAAIGGNATGILIHTAAASAGVAAVIAGSPLLFQTLRLAGAAYLLYLAFRALQSARGSAELAEASSPPRRRQVWFGGVSMSLLNPKILLLMLALLPQFIDPARGSAALQAGVLGALHATIASLTLTALTLTGAQLRRSRKLIRGLRWASAGALGGFGLRLVFDR